MMWYLLKPGSIRKRRVLTEEQLKKMAGAGEVHDHDLLWSEQTGNRWVRAAAIPNLLPKPEPKPQAPVQKSAPAAAPAPAQAAQAAQTRQAPSPKPQANNRQHRPAVIAVIIAALAIAGVFLADKLKKPEELPPAPPQPAESNIWAAVESDLAAMISENRIDDANALIVSYVEDKGQDAISARMKASVERHRKRQRLTVLYSLLLKGAAKDEEKSELLQSAADLGELANLKESIASTLSAKKPPSPEACRTLLGFSGMMKDRQLEILSVEALRAGLKVSSSEPDCMEIAGLYVRYNMQDKAIVLLREFVTAQPDSAEAWFELAALLAASARTEEALEALKTAVKLGGDDACIDAKRDPRFDSVKDTWTFKWNTR
jgi:tetratricopeptide (TPR) repeat protein